MPSGRGSLRNINSLTHRCCNPLLRLYPLLLLLLQVKRPEGVSAKYKAFLVQHGDTFKIDGETVSLQK